MSPNTTLITASSWRANWTNGDASAETEYWRQDLTGGGPWLLVAVVAAGTALYNDTGRQDHNTYKWRVRHRKGGVVSAFFADQTVLTLIAAPSAANLAPKGVGGSWAVVFVNKAHGSVNALPLRD